LILNVFAHGRWHRPASWPETEQLIAEVVENVPGPTPRTVPERMTAGLLEVLASLPEANRPYGGSTAEFTFANRRPGWAFDSYLRVAVNARTGHGALTWMLVEGSTVVADPCVANHVWLSDNPVPPAADPYVIADPGLPRYHHPRSTLPVERVRAAVEEFCRDGTGHRPTCVDWTLGEMSGQRLDTPALDDEPSPQCQDPWCEIPGPGHPIH
jgi:hypothetical protein